MILTLCISGATVLLMILSVIFKPYLQIKKLKIGLYYLITVVGAILLLATGALPLSTALDGITTPSAVNPIKILALFLSMTLISVFLGDAGFFDWVAAKLFAVSRGGVKLFILLYLIVAVLTVFTSNDVIILTLTPPICIFAKRAKISPIPYLIGEFVAANTWSMALIVGNPTNVYIASGAGIPFLQYFCDMALPTLLGGIVSLCILLALFYKPLTRDVHQDTDELIEPIVVRRTPLILALIHLGACIILLAVSEFINVEMWLVCTLICVSLFVFNLIYAILRDKNLTHLTGVLKKAPYELIPFVLSMFIIVLALDHCGFTAILSSALLTGDGLDGLIIGATSGLSANILNNIPMSVLFEKIVVGANASAVYGAIIGSNVGAFITPVGALAGIMWNKILTEHGVKLSFAKFILYGVAVAIPTLAVSCLTLLIL